MKPLARLPDSIRSGDDYLDVSQCLSQAIEAGISALAKGQIAEFKEQLARQEGCCFLLARVGAPDPIFSRAGYAWHEDNQELNARIRAAHKNLVRLNRLYRAFLRHSARSIDLLAAHCRTYLQGFDEAGECQSIPRVSLAEV